MRRVADMMRMVPISFKCKWAKHIWAALGLEQHRSILSEKMLPMDVVKYILQLKEEVQVCIVTFL